MQLLNMYAHFIAPSLPFSQIRLARFLCLLDATFHHLLCLLSLSIAFLYLQHFLRWISQAWSESSSSPSSMLAVSTL